MKKRVKEKKVKYIKISNFSFNVLLFSDIVFVLVISYNILYPQLILENVKVDKVILNQNIVDLLNNNFINNSNEFAVCLNGELKNNIFYITNFTTPYQEATPLDNNHEQCYSIGKLHSHIIRYENWYINNEIEERKVYSCEFSNQDIKSFIKGKNIINGLICDKNRFVFIARNEVNKHIDVYIQTNNSKRDVVVN